MINAYHPELSSKHRLRLSVKRHFSLKMRENNPLGDFAVLVNDAQFLVFFFSICTAMGEALTHNFHVLKYLKEIETRVQRARDQYFELSRAV